jgi:hypothetical protein
MVHRFTLEEIMDLSGIRPLAIHLFTTTSVLHFKWSDGEIINAK